MKNNTVSERILELMQKQDLSYGKLAEITGVPKSALQRYATGETRKLSFDRLKIIADALGCTSAYLLGWEADINRSMVAKNVSKDSVVYIPIAASVRAGFDGKAELDYEDEYEMLPASMLKGACANECVVVNVYGNSMYPKICDGDKVLVHLQSSVDSGDVAVVIYESDEATIKTVKYVYGEDWLELIPANPEYLTKRIKGSDLEKCHIVGKVIKLIRDF